MSTLHWAVKDLTGKQFGLLTVLRPTEKRTNGKVVWECRCKCGNMTESDACSLKMKWKQSCGCLIRKAMQEQPILTEIKSIAITKPIVVKRILELATQSHTSPKTWVETALEDWILKHRSGRYHGDASRFDAREPDRTAEYFD